MTDELRCRCGREVRLVRLNERTLALGHIQNPKNQMHAVRLARPALASAGSRVPTRSRFGGLACAHAIHAGHLPALHGSR